MWRRAARDVAVRDRGCCAGGAADGAPEPGELVERAPRQPAIVGGVDGVGTEGCGGGGKREQGDTPAIPRCGTGSSRAVAGVTGGAHMRQRYGRGASRGRTCDGAHRKAVGPVTAKSRRRPTLPGGLPPSTIGAGGLNCRVRNGNGCFPAAMATGNCALGHMALERPRASTSFLSPSPRPISTGQLNALPHVHFRPIYVVVWPRALPGLPCERSHLGTGFVLRCFQRLSHPQVANQPCPWQDNWHTRAASVPVLSY